MNIEYYRLQYIIYLLINGHTLISLKLRISVANVELTTDGLFLTLGKMTPPFRETVGFDDVLALAFTFGGNVLYGTVVVIVGPVVVAAVDDVGGYVVVGIGGSVKSSSIEYLKL